LTGDGLLIEDAKAQRKNAENSKETKNRAEKGRGMVVFLRRRKQRAQSH